MDGHKFQVEPSVSAWNEEKGKAHRPPVISDTLYPIYWSTKKWVQFGTLLVSKIGADSASKTWASSNLKKQEKKKVYNIGKELSNRRD